MISPDDRGSRRTAIDIAWIAVERFGIGVGAQQLKTFAEPFVNAGF